MAILLKKYQINNDKSTVDKMWDYRTVSFETIDIDALAKHMSNHNTPYSQGCIRGMLKDMCDCIKELLLDGKKVKIGDLAIWKSHADLILLRGVSKRKMTFEKLTICNSQVKQAMFYTRFRAITRHFTMP